MLYSNRYKIYEISGDEKKQEFEVFLDFAQSHLATETLLIGLPDLSRIDIKSGEPAASVGAGV